MMHQLPWGDVFDEVSGTTYGELAAALGIGGGGLDGDGDTGDGNGVEVPIAPVMPRPPIEDEDDDTIDMGGGGGVVAGSVVVPIATVLALLPLVLRQAAAAAIRAASRGGVAAWNRLPGWLRAILPTAGITVGTTIAVDLATDGIGSGPAGPGIPGGGQVVGGWTANGIQFYRLADGRLAVQNRKGRWRVWRPRRPIVLMPTGAPDLRTALRADAVLAKQGRAIAAMLRRRGYRVTRNGGPVKSADQARLLPPGGGRQVINIDTD